MTTNALEIRKVSFPVEDLSLRLSASGDGSIHLTGHAAVFNQLSHDLGGFRERLTPTAFSRVLSERPDVHLVIGHDMTRVLARTLSGTLELTEDDRGLKVWAKLDPEDPDVKSLIPKMKRGDIDQMSFAFTVRSDEWEWQETDEDEIVIRTITEVGGLYDVSVVAQGAYPQTDASLRDLFEAARAEGRVVGLRANNEEAAEATQDPSLNTDATESRSVSEFERNKALAVARAKAHLLQID